MIQEFYNYEIFSISNSLQQFQQDNTQYFPAKIIFFIEKNIQLFSRLNAAISEAKDSIVRHYGVLKDENFYIPEDKLQAANQELNELMFLKQQVEFSTIPLSWLEDYTFTPSQMAAITFMIDESK